MGWNTVAAILADWGTERNGDAAAWDDALAVAVALARRCEAHLDALCLGLDPTEPAAFYAGAGGYPLHLGMDRARDAAGALEARAEAALAQSGVPSEVRGAAVPAGALAPLVGSHVRFADVAVVPRPYGERPSDVMASVLEAVLFSGGIGAIVVPPGMRDWTPPRQVVLAWDESAEALVAARAALPLLKAAERVDIAVIDPPPHTPERSDPGGNIARMLSRHGVKAEISVLARTMPRIADILCRHAADRGADLIVMGAYGHSRMREAILGGPTRHMLELARVPVLMAH